MGLKKGKDITDDNYWRTQIEDYSLDDENWKVKVILIEPAGNDQDRMYLNKFEVFAAEERRFVIKNICKTETIFMINQLGVEKKIKDDNLRVFEEGQNYLKLKQDIPPDLLALIIKHLIMKMKDEYLFIKRQRLQVREGMRRESATIVDALEMRGTVNVPQLEPEPIPTLKKGKKAEHDLSTDLPEPDKGKKYNTQLRVRGEEWRDKVYVDDFPTDGPNLYVALTGFVETLLPTELLKIGVPLTAVIQVKIDSTSMQIPSSLFKTTKRRQSETEILTEKYVKFWEDLQELRIQKDTADIFKNTAFVIFSPPYWDTETLSGNPDKIYDELCFLMYDIQDLTRQHFHYLDNMDIINIPAAIGDIHIDKQYYQQIGDLPLECVTIYTILDAILQSVCKGQVGDEKSSRSSLSTALTINQPRISDDKIEKGRKLVKEVFNKLCSSEENKKSYRITQGQEYENYKDPIIINYGDFAKYNTFHLGNINLDNIVGSALFGLPLHKLWDNQKLQNAEIEAKISFHLNVLLSCFDREDVETAELYRLIHILAFRKLYNNRSSIKKQHLQSNTISNLKKTYLKRSILAEPLSKCSSLFPNSSSSLSPPCPSMTKYENNSDESYNSDSEERRVKFLFECPDISELVSATEIANEKPGNHSIDDFEYFEDFTEICAFQILLEAFNNFNCVDYKYCEVTDCFLLMFYNSHDKDGIAREEWRCNLSTPLCLQDFFDFVLEEHYDWIQNEETIYDQNVILKSQSVSKDFIDPLTLQSCMEDNEVEFDLLIEGSLKYQDVAQLEEPSSDSVDARLASSKKTTLSPSSDGSKSSKKTKSPIPSTPKNLRQPFITTAPDSKTSIIFPSKPFLGYDLGDRRVEVFGKDATYFSKDGTKVASVYTLIIPMNVEYIVLNVSPGNSYNTFWIHKTLGDEGPPEILDMCESFRITTKDQAMINIRKITYQVPVPLITKLSSTENKHKESILKNTQLGSDTQQILETKSFHSVCITWPNGLITESVHENNSSVISHIKQYYLNPLSHLNEEMRCITLNAEVIIFKIFGDIEILRSDGSYIKITKSQKRIITSRSSNDSQSETSSDKSKKLKGRDKSGKGGKPSKLSSKSSKNTLSEGDMDSGEKNPEYELVIEEFESIDSSGLRQKWIKDTAFDIEKLLIRTATDYCLGEVFSRRMDGTNILLNKDGLQIVTFPNGTRIISHCIELDEEIFPEWTAEEKEHLDMPNIDIMETGTIKSKTSISQKSYKGDTSTYHVNTCSSVMEKLNEDFVKKDRTDGYVAIKMIYTIEHANFTTVTINKICEKISIESPNNNSVNVDPNNNHYEIQLDSVTTAKFNGENLLINYEACPECQSSTVCNIQIKPKENSSVTKTWLKMKDSFCKNILVDDEGNINVIDEPSTTDLLHVEDVVSADKHDDNEDIEDRVPDRKSESSVMSHGKCREKYVAKTIRYFVLKREMTCSELVHRVLVEQCVQSCRWQPWCSINKYDTFGDHRNLVSLLIPLHLTESEKWLMDSKLADKPKYLTYKDLKEDTGKGFYHWMRPYERFEPKPIKPDNVLPPRLPRAFILRILEQQWNEKERNELKGAKELLNAILRYRHIIESNSETILNIPIVDLRTDEERHVDDIVQAVAHRIYENLKTRLEEDVQSRVQTSITTQPRPTPSEVSVEGEMDEDSFYKLRALEEERKNIINEIEGADKASENLKRYWRRRAEEYNEEKFYQYLLREGSVPPYFRNVLGGAIWWEMNNTADEAVTKAETKKMNCVCECERASRAGNTAMDP